MGTTGDFLAYLVAFFTFFILTIVIAIDPRYRVYALLPFGLAVWVSVPLVYAMKALGD